MTPADTPADQSAPDRQYIGETANHHFSPLVKSWAKGPFKRSTVRVPGVSRVDEDRYVRVAPLIIAAGVGTASGSVSADAGMQNITTPSRQLPSPCDQNAASVVSVESNAIETRAVIREGVAVGWLAQKLLGMRSATP